MVPPEMKVTHNEFLVKAESYRHQPTVALHASLGESDVGTEVAVQCQDIVFLAMDDFLCFRTLLQPNNPTPGLELSMFLCK